MFATSNGPPAAATEHARDFAPSRWLAFPPGLLAAEEYAGTGPSTGRYALQVVTR